MFILFIVLLCLTTLLIYILFRSNKKNFLIANSLMLLFATFLYPYIFINADSASYLEIVVSVSDNYNENAQGNEIWIKGAEIDGRFFEVKDLLVSGEWQWIYYDNYEQLWWPGYKQDGLTKDIIIKIPAGLEQRLIFQQNIWRGVVDISYSGINETVDCYDNTRSLTSYLEFEINQQKTVFEFIVVALKILTIWLILFVSYNFMLLIIQLYQKKVFQFVKYNTAKINATIEICIFICLLPVIGLLLANVSVSSTPLVEGFYGYDAACYTYAANAWAKGFIPYKDFFVNKGPLVYLIYMANVLIGERWGVFLLQCLAMWISLIGAYLIGKRIGGFKSGFLSVIGTLAFYLVFVDEGALNEEFNLPFLMFAVYLIIKYILNIDIQRQHSPKYAFYYGVTFGVMLWTRVTDSVYLNAFIFTICVFLLIKHEYKNFMANALAFILGFGLIFLPFVIYFAINNALPDLFRLFSANLSYSSYGRIMSAAEQQQYMFFLIPIWLCLIISIEQKGLLKYGLINATISTALWLYNSYMLPHYYVITLVFIPIFIGLSFKRSINDTEQKNTNYIQNKKNDKILEWNFLFRLKAKMVVNRYTLVYALLILIICISVLHSSVDKINNRKGWIKNLQLNNSFEYAYIDAANELVSEIPAEDKNDVVIYGTRSEFSIATDIYSNYELLGGIDWLIDAYANEEENKQKKIAIDLALIPKWVIVQGEITNKQICDIIQEEYILVKQVKVVGFEEYCMDIYKLKP